VTLTLILCDVFAERALAGNSLTVVVHDEPLDATFMQALTRELRQFETVFVRRDGESRAHVRVFDLNRELAFAGHPLLGAGAALHALDGDASPARRTWELDVNGRVVPVSTTNSGAADFLARMDQGRPTLLGSADHDQTQRALEAFSLSAQNLAPDLVPEVMSTGLRYLVVPIADGLADAKVVHPQLETLLIELDAEFAYLLDVSAREGRHWENDGSIEDIATGSAAGVAGAYLVRHGLASADEEIVLRQGRFVGRPSALHVTVRGPASQPSSVQVAGPVTMVAHGILQPSVVEDQ
jgi:trans-2,3-dihydro-3-hydroxyanthranilate isomerase